MTDPAEFQALAASIGAEISSDGARRLLAFLDAMLEENKNVNLTAIRDPEAAVLLHALDSVALGCGGFEKPPAKALDLGTGNGFPGVAVACLFPAAHVVLMDRTQKKLKAITRALESAGFDAGQFDTLHMDAAEAPARGYRSKFDLVTTRAVGPPIEVGLLARPLLVRGGRLLTWISDSAQAPPALKGAMRKLAQFEYVLPAPADRVRYLVHYGR